CNIRIKALTELVIEAEFLSFQGKKEKNLSWIAEERALEVEVTMPSADKLLGITDSSLLRCSVDEVVHFDNFGFARIDKLEKNSAKLWFAHR
ncbi:MAG: hypothetical protein J7L14_01885, partial [Candidatus Diapherotrites archaeon]|nr:hypothetical protein [Candidatus Diapherotrites archaeon]